MHTYYMIWDFCQGMVQARNKEWLESRDKGERSQVCSVHVNYAPHGSDLSRWHRNHSKVKYLPPHEVESDDYIIHTLLYIRTYVRISGLISPNKVRQDQLWQLKK